MSYFVPIGDQLAIQSPRPYNISMTDTLYIDKRGLRAYKSFLRKLQRKLIGAAGMTLNEFAFGSRVESIKYIQQNMTVRNQTFVKSALWAERARFAKGINGMQSKVGSVARNRFTGWKEQIQGADMPRDRAITTAARGGSRASVVARRNRLKPGKKWKEPKQFKGKTMRERANTMLQTLGRKGAKMPFIIYGHRTLPSGLWMFGGGPKDKRRLIALQLFGRKTKVRRDMWLKKAVSKYFRSNPAGHTWKKYAKQMSAKLNKTIR